jgi:adenylate kinase
MRLVLLGPPGAGKGTLGARLSASLRIPHLSTGELLRAAIRGGDQDARVILSGAFVPDEVATRLILPRLDLKQGFLLDGYPRTLAQAESLAAFTPLDAVLLLELSQAALDARLAGRRVCPECAASYHLVAAPPRQAGVCDRCGGALTLRPEDDTPEKRRVRTQLYQEKTASLIGFYEAAGLLHRIDSSGPPEIVWEISEKALVGP